MNFASLTFWGSLAGGFLLLSLFRSFFKKSPNFDQWAFIALSLFLLGIESLETVIIFLSVSGLGYLGLFCRQRWQLVVIALLMISPLGFYKYSGFLEEIWTGEKPPTRLLIPMGISFYTFQVLSFVIDSFRLKLPLPSLRSFLNFASFFPQIVAGPIERRSDLLPQVEALRFRLTRKNVEDGIPWIVLGFFFKLALAENLALVIEGLKPDSTNALKVWAEAAFFAGRIYFDFAGYSFIALGLARCFNIRLTLNFESPYLATNLRSFWRRWHVTLTRWFRDYLYVPMGGNQTRFWPGAILIVFLVSGVWHGAGWGFIIWGGLHGIGVLCCALMGKRSLPVTISRTLTLVFLLTTWIFFMTPDWKTACHSVSLIASPHAYHLSLPAVIGIFGDEKALIHAALMSALMGLVFLGEWLSLRHRSHYLHFTNRWVQLALILATVLFAPTTESRFIYFNF